MTGHKYERGDILREVHAPNVMYRVERRLTDLDTGVLLYQLKLLTGNEEVFRNAKLVHSNAMELVLG